MRDCIRDLSLLACKVGNWDLGQESVSSRFLGCFWCIP